MIDRGDGETWTVIATTPKSVTLRRSRDGALDAVGGSGSPAGSALWYVAGLGQSVREWALRQGWAGKAISLHEANQNVEPSVVSFTQKQVKVIRGPSCQG